MDTIRLRQLDHVHLAVDADPGIAYELKDSLTFRVPGYQHMPKYKSGMWDGNISLFNPWKKRLYVGLRRHLEGFAEARDYRVDASEVPDPGETVTTEDVEAFVSELDLPSHITPHDYQVEAVRHSIESGRATILSPTASGKSLVIYILMRWYASRHGAPTLVIVPTKALVRQMYGDFRDYGFDVESSVHMLHGGHEKTTDKPVVVSTWQSIYKMGPEWFARFRLVIGDEVHQFKAASLTSIMEKLVDCPYRFGLTGTLDGTAVNELVITGLFGPVFRATTTRELMDRGMIAGLKIEAILLRHDEETRRAYWKTRPKYSDEIARIVSHPGRNRFLRNLATSLKGNTIVLFNLVEDHGEPLFDAIRARVPDRPVYYASGKVDVEERDEIRRLLETHDDAIAVVSYGTFSTGINVKRIDNVVLASPSKSRVRVLQSIGRGLRKLEGKVCTLYDIGDDLTLGSRANHTLGHMTERIELYASEGFQFKTHVVDV